ncbi:hypothetical protein ACFX13_014275 [Malus domestica]
MSAACVRILASLMSSSFARFANSNLSTGTAAIFTQMMSPTESAIGASPRMRTQMRSPRTSSPISPRLPQPPKLPAKLTLLSPESGNSVSHTSFSAIGFRAPKPP